jgi:hypothetical protein
MRNSFVVLCLVMLALAALSACGGDDATPGADTSPAATAVPAERPEGRLTMCVEAVRGVEEYQDEALKRLGDAVAEVQKDRRWARYFPSAEPPVVDGGCPEEPAPPAVNFVEKPGFYRVYVFVVRVVPYNVRFAQEVVRTSAGSGVEATAGLFVTTDDLCDGGKLAGMLMAAAGFDHAPLPTNTPQADGPTATPCISPG